MNAALQQVFGESDLADAPPEHGRVSVWWHQTRSGPPSGRAWDARNRPGPTGDRHGPTTGITAQGLSPGERDRAARFLDDEARASFVAGRWIVRMLLGRWLGRRPDEVPILIDPQGRPYLGPPGAGWDFSITHAGGLVAVAVTRTGRVGIDLEAERRAIPVLEELQARVLAESERSALAGVAPEARGGTLVRLWAMKEAVLKALGTGLSLDPSRVEIDLAAGARPVLRGTRWGGAGEWALQWWKPLPGFMGALAWHRTGDAPARATATLPASGSAEPP